MQSGDEKSIQIAVLYFRHLSDYGLGRASYNTAVAYSRGVGVAKDPSRAAQFMLTAAKQGHAKSYRPLADMILRGELPVCRNLPDDCRRLMAAQWLARGRRSLGLFRTPEFDPNRVSGLYQALGTVGYR